VFVLVLALVDRAEETQDGRELWDVLLIDDSDNNGIVFVDLLTTILFLLRCCCCWIFTAVVHAASSCERASAPALLFLLLWPFDDPEKDRGLSIVSFDTVWGTWSSERSMGFFRLLLVFLLTLLSPELVPLSAKILISTTEDTEEGDATRLLILPH
jgi:hypothetical protein